MTQFSAFRLLADGHPKRILALDGGGVRGIISIAFLERIEATIQRQLGLGDEFVLADYFDLIGGTSVGSILATMLALGMRVSEVERLFREWAPQIFRRRFLGRGILRPLIAAGRLGARIEEVVGNEMLGSHKLRTGLGIIAKRADTGSVWVLINNERNRYWHPERKSNGTVRRGISEYLLRDLIRASTAAPRYFSPKRISVFKGVSDGLFVDGAVSPHNNPALQLLLAAHIEGYGLRWPLGASKLLLISVGTGSFAHGVRPRWLAGHHAIDSLMGVIGDGQDLVLTMLQWMSRSREPWVVDRAIGSVAAQTLGLDQGLAEPLLSFARYDVRLEKDWLETNLNRRFSDRRLEQVRDFTSCMDIETLHQLGSAAARRQVEAVDFPREFVPVPRTT